MKYFIYSVFLLVALWSCTEQKAPEVKTLERYRFFVRGGNQRAPANSTLTDSVGLSINGLLPSNDLQVFFKVIRGGGMVEDGKVVPDFRSMALTRWQTGSASTLQEIKAEVYNASGDLLKSVNLRSYALREGMVDTLYDGDDLFMNDMAYNAPGDTTFFTTFNGLYGQGNRYFNWVNDTRPAVSNARSIEFDGQGSFYIASSRGEIYKSTDRGVEWEELVEPFPGYNDIIDLQATSNGYLWATTYYGDHGLKCSRDGGSTWSIDSSGLDPKERMNDIYRLPDGRFLLLTKDQNLYSSSDDGHTWNPLPSPDNPFKLFVGDQQEVIVMEPARRNGEWGYAVYKYNNIDSGSFEEVAHIPSGVNMRIRIHSYQGMYYLGIPFEGIYTTADFVDFEKFAGIPDLRELYMTAEGTLIGTDIQRERVFYRTLQSD